MKQSSDFLWRLIRALNSKEKLFFKRNFSSNGAAGQPLYLKLFDAIAAQKKYDEAAILKKFSPALNKKNLPFQKHYLQSRVCEAVVQYDSRNNISHEIYSQVQLVRVYRKKGLLGEAHALWKKAVARARYTESYPLLNLLKTEFEKMVLSSNLHTPYDELHSVFKGHKITYTQYAELITLRDIYTEVLLLKRKVHYELDHHLRARLSHLLEQVNECKDSAQSRSFWFRHYFQMNKATLLYLLNDIPGSLSLLRQTFSDWKNHPHFISTHTENYIELLYMINYAGILNGSYAYVEECFNLDINDQIREIAHRYNFEAIKCMALNKIYNKTARYEEVKKLMDFMKDRYRLWEPYLNTDMNRTLQLSLGIGFFVLDQYADALFFVRRGITEYREGAREEQSAIAHLLLLAICHSMNNPKLFDAQYRAAYSYFHKRKKIQPFETGLLQCLHRSFYMKDPKSRMEEYKKVLELFEKNKDNVVQQMAFSIFNYPGWMTSKVQKISYRQYVERKVKAGRESLPAV